MIGDYGVNIVKGYSEDQILAFTDPQVSVSVVLKKDEIAKIIKAGTPIHIDLENRATAAEVAKEVSGASNANAVLLHSVNVENKDANGTALIFGFVNIDRLDTSVKALVTAEAKKALNGKVTFLK